MSVLTSCLLCPARLALVCKQTPPHVHMDSGDGSTLRVLVVCLNESMAPGETTPISIIHASFEDIEVATEGTRTPLPAILSVLPSTSTINLRTVHSVTVIPVGASPTTIAVHPTPNSTTVDHFDKLKMVGVPRLCRPPDAEGKPSSHADVETEVRKLLSAHAPESRVRDGEMCALRAQGAFFPVLIFSMSAGSVLRADKTLRGTWSPRTASSPSILLGTTFSPPGILEQELVPHANVGSKMDAWTSALGIAVGAIQAWSDDQGDGMAISLPSVAPVQGQPHISAEVLIAWFLSRDGRVGVTFTVNPGSSGPVAGAGAAGGPPSRPLSRTVFTHMRDTLLLRVLTAVVLADPTKDAGVRMSDGQVLVPASSAPSPPPPLPLPPQRDVAPESGAGGGSGSGSGGGGSGGSSVPRTDQPAGAHVALFRRDPHALETSMLNAVTPGLPTMLECIDVVDVRWEDDTHTNSMRDIHANAMAAAWPTGAKGAPVVLFVQVTPWTMGASIACQVQVGFLHSDGTTTIHECVKGPMDHSAHPTGQPYSLVAPALLGSPEDSPVWMGIRAPFVLLPMFPAPLKTALPQHRMPHRTHAGLHLPIRPLRVAQPRTTKVLAKTTSLLIRTTGRGTMTPRVNSTTSTAYAITDAAQGSMYGDIMVPPSVDVTVENPVWFVTPLLIEQEKAGGKDAATKHSSLPVLGFPGCFGLQRGYAEDTAQHTPKPLPKCQSEAAVTHGPSLPSTGTSSLEFHVSTNNPAATAYLFVSFFWSEAAAAFVAHKQILLEFDRGSKSTVNVPVPKAVPDGALLRGCARVYTSADGGESITFPVPFSGQVERSR